MMILKWFIVVFFTFLLIIILYGIKKDSDNNKRFLEEHGRFFIKFNTKVPFFLCLYFIIVGKVSEDFSELFKYGDEIYHFIFNDVTYSISTSIIATFLFLLATYVNDLRKAAGDIEMTKIYLEYIIENCFGNIEFEGKILSEYLENKKRINYKELLNKFNNGEIRSQDINKLKNISETSIEIKKINWIHWHDTTPLKWWFEMIIMNCQENGNNKRGVFLGTLNYIIGINEIIESPVKYIYKKLL